MAAEAEKDERARLALKKLLLPALMKKTPTVEPPDSTDMQVEDNVEFKPVAIEVAPICARVNIAAQMIGVGKTKLYELMEAGTVVPPLLRGGTKRYSMAMWLGGPLERRPVMLRDSERKQATPEHGERWSRDPVGPDAHHGFKCHLASARHVPPVVAKRTQVPPNALYYRYLPP